MMETDLYSQVTMVNPRIKLPLTMAFFFKFPTHVLNLLWTYRGLFNLVWSFVLKQKNNFLISQLINTEFLNLFYGTSPRKQITAGQKKKQMNKNNIGLKLNEIFELISFLWESKKKALTACNTTEACEIHTVHIIVTSASMKRIKLIYIRIYKSSGWCISIDFWAVLFSQCNLSCSLSFLSNLLNLLFAF